MAIDRIGTAANSQLLLNQIQRAELALNLSNRQVATGKLADTYSGYGDKTAIMEAARSASAHADANVAAAKQASARLDLQDVHVTQLGDLIGEVRQALMKAAADQDGTSLMSQMEGFFNQALEILNTKDANGYLYAGDKNQTPPVAVNSLAGLAVLPLVSDAFANGTIKTSMRIGESQTVQVGLLASELGTELFTLLQQVAQFDAGVNGPFGGTTTPAQQSFIESRILPAADAMNGVLTQAAANGIRYRTVQQVMDRLEASATVYKGFVSNIEDVDMTEALSRLNQNQIALQAAFQVTATLNRMSLLDFLPII